MDDDDLYLTPEESPGDGAASAPDQPGDGAPPDDDEEGATPARRRRRGRRGGRRHRRKGDDGATPSVTEAGEAAGAKAATPMEAESTAAGEDAETPTKRRPRRRRGTPPAGSQAAGGDAAPAFGMTITPPAEMTAGQGVEMAAGPSAELLVEPAVEPAKPSRAKGPDAKQPRAKKKKSKAKPAAEPAKPSEAKDPDAKRHKPKKSKAELAGRPEKPSRAKGSDPKQSKAKKKRPMPEPAGESTVETAVRPAEPPLQGAARPGAKDEVTAGAGEAAVVADEGAAPPGLSSPRRRGHRGGRGRRRKVVEAVVSEPTALSVEVRQRPVESRPEAGPPPEAAPPAHEAPPGVVDADETASVADEAVIAVGETAAVQEPAARKRRGHRGGRGRRKVVGEHPSPGHESVERGSELSAEAPVAGGVTAALEAAEEEQEEPARRSGRGRRGLARVEGGQADLPEHKQILVTVEGDELRVALVEDGRLAEIYIERPGKRSYAGNIYLGKVDNVIPGMDAAFVEIGLEKNGFLYVDEVAVEDEEKRPRHITEVLKPRQELLVQVMKDPMGSKGARLTGQLSLAGRYLVYVPGGSGVGVSRRLGVAERDRLRDLCEQLRPRKAGLIVRTVAEGKGLDELRRDLQFLSRLWSRLKVRAGKITAPGLLYEEADVSLQVARDLFNDTFETVIVDDKKQHDKFVSYLKKEAPELADRMRAYEGEHPLFDEYGIEEQIAKALDRRVRLPSGGNIVIDHAEALTVIDVNTGRYTAGRDLEETITKTNLEAAREVVRQLRLRDIGGIIIIDFIDMAYARNRDAVLAKLQAELDTDRTKTYVVEISPLGLVEMTRQNITDGARGILTKECPSCTGKARILSEDTSARNAVRTVRRQARTAPHEAFLYELNHGVAERITGMGWLKALEKETGKRVFFEGSQTLPVDTLRLIAAGSRQDIERQRVPVHEGQELEVELEHTLTYSPGDAVAHVDGYVITVVGGRPFLGKRRMVKVTSMTRTGAFATLVGKRRR